MAIPESVSQAFGQHQTALSALETQVRGTLRAWCDEKSYLFSGRRKDLPSLAEKLESGRFEQWSSIDDLYACTVVVPTTSHETGVIAFLDAAFTRIQLRERNSTKKAPDVFRFDSTRYIGKLRDEIGLTLVPGAADIRFEVQIPTVFEYAWTVATHDLVYKTGDVDWRKERLASQLKAAVEQIELIIAGFQNHLDFVAQSGHPETEAKGALVEGYKSMFADGCISPGMEPASWSRFADNVFALVKSFSGAWAAPGKLVDLTAALNERLRETNELADLQSGSLFQSVVSLVATGIIEGAHINNFVVVDSGELHEFFDLGAVPKPFVFD